MNLVKWVGKKQTHKKSLYEFFDDIKHALHLPEDIKLRWIPTENTKIRGTVSKDGKTIFIFDKDEEEAKKTLLHECIELLIVKLASLIVNPVAKEEKELYKIKEAVVEVLRMLIREEEVSKRAFINEFIKELKEVGGEDYIE